MALPRRQFLMQMAAAAAWSPLARAGSYPDRPIKLVVTFPPGGGSDTIARALGVPLSEALGQPVVVENMPGAFGSVAGAHVSKTPGDGYTLMLGTTGTLPIPVAMGVKLPYDTLKDFTPVTQVAITPLVLVVSPDFPAKDFKEFAAVLKKSGSKPSFYGSWGTGSIGHFAGELLKTRAGLPMTHVPYKGSGLLVTDLLAGHVKIGFLEGTTAAPFVQSGKLRGLAVAATQRAPNLPDLPTLSEVGVPFDQSGWYGLVAPKDMPADVLARLNTELGKILRSDEMRKKFASLGITPAASSPAEFRKTIESDIQTWTQVAKVAQIKAQ